MGLIIFFDNPHICENQIKCVLQNPQSNEEIINDIKCNFNEWKLKYNLWDTAEVAFWSKIIALKYIY